MDAATPTRRSTSPSSSSAASRSPSGTASSSPRTRPSPTAAASAASRSPTTSARPRRSTPRWPRPRRPAPPSAAPAPRRSGAATPASSSTRTATRGRSPTTRTGRSRTTGPCGSRARPGSASVAGRACQEMEPAGDCFLHRSSARRRVPGPETSSPARSALSCHPPEERLRPGGGGNARSGRVSAAFTRKGHSRGGGTARPPRGKPSSRTSLRPRPRSQRRCAPYALRLQRIGGRYGEDAHDRRMVFHPPSEG